MRRRQFLATGTALLSIPLAGCVDSPYLLDLTPATPSAVADVVSFRPEPGSTEYEVVTAALENGSTTRDDRRDIFGGDTTVRVDGAVYEVSGTVVDSREVPVYTVEIDFEPDDTTAELGAIQYEELPAVDRDRLDDLLSRDSVPDNDGPDVGVGYGAPTELAGDSVFVPDQKYDILVYEGSRYRITVESRTEREATYEYEVTEVAPSVDAYAAQLREEYQFALTGLSEAERAVVEQAIESEYIEESDPLKSILDTLRSNESLVENDFSGKWLVRYEDVAYVALASWA